jgi:CheY-like chemotaxis protein
MNKNSDPRADYSRTTSSDSKERQTPSQKKNLEGVRILLAEDVPDNQMLLKIYLQGTGAQIDIANDGEEAVSKARSQNYDLILMDIQMPKMDGIEATRQLRSQGFNSPILALTAHAMGEEITRSLTAGCNAHLTKPIMKATLLAAIQEHLKSTAHH